MNVPWYAQDSNLPKAVELKMLTFKEGPGIDKLIAAGGSQWELGEIAQGVFFYKGVNIADGYGFYRGYVLLDASILL